MNNPEFIYDLECFIDANSLQDALQLISSVCWEKAAHIESNWQDSNLAKIWANAAKRIDSLSVSEAILRVPSPEAK